MKISILVIVAHLLLIVTSLFFQLPEKKIKTPRPIKVHTIALQEEPIISIPPPQPLKNLSFGLSPSNSEEFAQQILQCSTEANGQRPFARSKSTRDASKVPEDEEEKLKTQVKKLKTEKHVVNITKLAAKPVTKPKPVPSPAAPKKNLPDEKLKRLLQESLASCDKTEIIKPKQIGSLSCETLLYQERLIAFLESNLTLPEKGEVKLSLTLNRQGVVQKIALQGKTSEKNRLFVETTLPTLALPPFGNDYKGEKSHTFSITLTSS